jgi:hypothetical protein
VQLAIYRGAAGFDIGDVEDLPIGATRKTRTDRLAHDRARPITTRDVAGLANIFATPGAAKISYHPVTLGIEADQFGLALHEDAKRLEPFDQQPLVLVLLDDLREGIGSQVRANGFEG